jgi:hypothetical protein
MIRLLAIMSLYLAMLLAWTGAGLFRLLAPASCGKFVHLEFNCYQDVNPGG